MCSLITLVWHVAVHQFSDAVERQYATPSWGKNRRTHVLPPVHTAKHIYRPHTCKKLLAQHATAPKVLQHNPFLQPLTITSMPGHGVVVHPFIALESGTSTCWVRPSSIHCKCRTAGVCQAAAAVRAGLCGLSWLSQGVAAVTQCCVWHISAGIEAGSLGGVGDGR